jgi:hypothetical protein
MTAITADLDQHISSLELGFQHRFWRAYEALTAIRDQHGTASVIAWARAADDAEAPIAALAVFAKVPLALNLIADLERAKLSGNPRKVAKVRRRLDRVLATIAKNEVR